MSVEAFWDLTPAEFHAMLERRADLENREFMRAGTIAAAIYNVNRDSHRHPRPFTAHDIFDLPRPAAMRPSRAQKIARMDEFFRRVEKRTKQRAS